MKSLVRPAYLRQAHGSSSIGDVPGPRSSETHLNSLLRVNLAYMACMYEVEECCQKAKADFKAWADLENPDDLDSNP